MLRPDDWEERAAIMQFDGGLPLLEAERLAQQRPWDSDPYWGMPKPHQPELDLGGLFFSEMERMFR